MSNPPIIHDKMNLEFVKEEYKWKGKLYWLEIDADVDSFEEHSGGDGWNNPSEYETKITRIDVNSCRVTNEDEEEVVNIIPDEVIEEIVEQEFYNTI